MKRNLLEEERGVAYAEFLIAFPVMFLLFLSIVQVAQVYVAHLMVRSASIKAARSAIVVIPDDPGEYGGEEVNTIGGEGCGGGGGDGGLGGGGDPTAGLAGITSGILSGHDSCRMRAIRTAASFPLIPLAPDFGSQFGGGEENLGTSLTIGAERLGFGILYNRAAMSVTFPESPGSMDFLGEFDRNQPLTTRVTYLYQCDVPLVNDWVCHDPISLVVGTGGDTLRSILDGDIPSDLPGVIDAGMDLYEGYMGRREDLKNGMSELYHAESFWWLAPYLMSDKRFTVLRGEITLPNQWAPYEYE